MIMNMVLASLPALAGTRPINEMDIAHCLN